MDRRINPGEKARQLRALADKVERLGTPRALELARRLRIRAAEHEIGPDAGGLPRASDNGTP
jgi:hypothetical protein